MKQAWGIVIGAGVGVFLIGTFIYPGRYIYRQIGTEDVVRVDRFTGVKAYSTGDGWRTEKEMLAEAVGETKKQIWEWLRAKKVTRWRTDQTTLYVTSTYGSTRSLAIDFSDDLIDELWTSVEREVKSPEPFGNGPINSTEYVGPRPGVTQDSPLPAYQSDSELRPHAPVTIPDAPATMGASQGIAPADSKVAESGMAPADLDSSKPPIKRPTKP